jgi:hypothetical protein
MRQTSQHRWITQHVAKTTYNIIILDQKDTEIGKSLQNILMDIPSSTENKNLPLFLSIDKSWKGSGYTVSFHPKEHTDQRIVRKTSLHPRRHDSQVLHPTRNQGGRAHDLESYHQEGLLGRRQGGQQPSGTRRRHDVQDPSNIGDGGRTRQTKSVFRAGKTDNSVLTFTEGSK